MDNMTEALNSTIWYIENRTACKGKDTQQLFAMSAFRPLVHYRTIPKWREDSGMVEILKKFLKKFSQIKTVRDIFSYIDSDGDTVKVGSIGRLVLRCSVDRDSRFYKKFISRDLYLKIQALPSEVSDTFCDNIYGKFNELLDEKLSETFPNVTFKVIQTDPICSGSERFIRMDKLIPIERVLAVYDSAAKETLDNFPEIAKSIQKKLKRKL